MKTIGAVLLVAILGGCTSVKLVQRDGCWVRRTEKWPGRVSEEIGPCTPPQTQWSNDRLTRVVQECIARTDYHWQTRALIAWNKGMPLPDRASEASVLQDCMNETTRALTTDNDRLRQQNDVLQKRLGEVGSERDALRARADDAGARLLATDEKLADRLLAAQDRMGDKLLTAQGRMAEYLGEAAKKSSQPAVATATSNSSSDGSATTDSSASSPTHPAAAVAASVKPTATCAIAPKERATRQARAGANKAVRATRMTCPPVAAAPATAAPEPKAEVVPADAASRVPARPIPDAPAGAGK